MSWLDLLAYVPLMAAIALVLGITGERGTQQVLRESRSRFLGLSAMVLVLGLCMRLVVTLFL
ncbi:MAG: hypothetical protein ACKOSS_02110 [Planctomycetia bacterium]